MVAETVLQGDAQFVDPTGGGRDGDLVWFAFAQASGTPYHIIWAERQSTWAFDAFGDRREDVEALVQMLSDALRAAQ